MGAIAGFDRQRITHSDEADDMRQRRFAFCFDCFCCDFLLVISARDLSPLQINPPPHWVSTKH
jgi:hypothetical protein